MVKATGNAIGEADAAILVVEAREAVGDIEEGILASLRARKMGAVLVINKIDTVTPVNIAKTIDAYSKAYPFDAVIPMCAKNGKEVETLLQECERYLEESAWFFPDDIVTDQPERQIAAEIIREKLLRTLDEEIPHGTAVVIEEFKEEKGMIRIRAEIFCERDSHKGIIIGKQGVTLKTVGMHARQDMEAFFGVKVFLDLWVKVKNNWRDSSSVLGNFGYRDE